MCPFEQLPPPPQNASGAPADDTRVVNGVNNVSDTSNFQRGLLNIYDWASSNNMKFNGQKFEELSYGKDEALKTLTDYQSSIGTAIDQKDSVRDLGVIMSNDATFSGHINHVIEIANKTTGLKLRSFKSRSKDLMITPGP